MMIFLYRACTEAQWKFVGNLNEAEVLKRKSEINGILGKKQVQNSGASNSGLSKSQSRKKNTNN
jgi:hypothetical protein